MLFKGGVSYRGSIAIKDNGTAEQPIVYKGDGWPEGVKAVIDGSELIASTWTKCQSQDEAGGNPNWRNIWHTYIPGGDNAYFVNIFEDDSFCHVAQYPIPSDPFFNDNLADYMHPDSVTRICLIDSRLGGLGGADLIGKRVFIRLGANRVDSFRITGYIPAENKITYDDLGSDPWTGVDGYFALANRAGFIDSPGKYAYEETARPDGTHKIYLWPHSPDPNGARITYTVRRFGVDVGGRSRVIAEGFIIRKFGASQAHEIGIGTVRVSDRTSDILIRNNIVEYNRCVISGGHGGIRFSNGENIRIENNLVQYNPHHFGIFLDGCADVVIKANKIKKGYTGICLFTLNNCQILDNTIENCMETHANAIALYQNSNNILVARNRIAGTSLGICISGVLYEDKQKNMIIYGNIVDGKNKSGQILRNYSDAAWPIIVCNNTVIGDDSHFSISYNRADRSAYIIKNNIVDGMSGWTEFKRSHNLYVGLSWQQSGTWIPGPNDVIDSNNGKYTALDQNTVMLDSLNEDYRLKQGSRAIDSGTDIYSYLTTLAQTDPDIDALLKLFPDFDWTLDIAGNRRGQGAGWDIGAYEYVDGFYLTSPNGGKIWLRGTSHTITWSASGVTEPVRIELLKGGVLDSVIAENQPVANGSYAWSIPADQATGNDYSVRLAAGAHESTSGTFSIVAAGAPVVTTDPAMSVTQTAAVLRGAVHPMGYQTTYRFEYGLTAVYGSTTPAVALNADADATTVQAALAGLTTGTVYHFRLVAENSAGASEGFDRTFTTASSGGGGDGGGEAGGGGGGGGCFIGAGSAVAGGWWSVLASAVIGAVFAGKSVRFEERREKRERGRG